MENKKREELISLFDIYQGLLTKKQNEYFTSYFFDDLSITEIAEEAGISRNGVFDQVKKVCAILEKYEETLNLYAKKNKIKKILSSSADKKLAEEIESILEE